MWCGGMVRCTWSVGELSAGSRPVSFACLFSVTQLWDSACGKQAQKKNG